jgi:hypothetical protein
MSKRELPVSAIARFRQFKKGSIPVYANLPAME